MRNLFVLAVVWVLLVFALPHYASAEGKAPASQETKVNYQKLTKMDFEEKAVDGQFVRPEGQAVDGDRGLDFDSLLAPRSDFQKELKRSSGAVR